MQHCYLGLRGSETLARCVLRRESGQRIVRMGAVLLGAAPQPMHPRALMKDSVMFVRSQVQVQVQIHVMRACPEALQTASSPMTSEKSPEPQLRIACMWAPVQHAQRA